MKFGIALILAVFCLTGCSAIAGKIDAPVLMHVAPDVPAVAPEVQDAAALEVKGGACRALTTLAATCLITRDESRALRGEKTK